MGRKKKINNESSDDTLTIGKPLDLSEYSTPAPVEDKPLPVDVDLSKVNESLNGNPFVDGEPQKEKRKYKKRNQSEDSQGDLLIDGETLIMFIDLVIPMIISFVNNKVTDSKISPDDLMLTEKQKLQAKKLADKVASKIDINVNPVWGLIAMLGGMYTYKVIELKNK